jgi:hypothetical protein
MSRGAVDPFPLVYPDSTNLVRRIVTRIHRPYARERMVLRPIFGGRARPEREFDVNAAEPVSSANAILC